MQVTSVIFISKVQSQLPLQKTKGAAGFSLVLLTSGQGCSRVPASSRGGFSVQPLFKAHGGFRKNSHTAVDDNLTL